MGVVIIIITIIFLHRHRFFVTSQYGANTFRDRRVGDYNIIVNEIVVISYSFHCIVNEMPGQYSGDRFRITRSSRSISREMGKTKACELDSSILDVSQFRVSSLKQCR